MKLNVLLSLLVLSKNSLPLPLEVPECARVIDTPALDVRLSRKHPRAPWTPCSEQPPLKMVQVMSTRGHPTEQEAGPRRRLKVLSPTVGAGSAENLQELLSAQAGKRCSQEVRQASLLKGNRGLLSLEEQAARVCDT